MGFFTKLTIIQENSTPSIASTTLLFVAFLPVLASALPAHKTSSSEYGLLTLVNSSLMLSMKAVLLFQLIFHKMD